nr:UDP-N-acetylmuramoyl-L-alanyl-D-glutamate--2,6-diaminopimelate ligase [uncultured Cetobacterium sp.]
MEKIFDGIEYKVLKKTDRNIKYKELEYDSRKIKSGDIFVALEGTAVDGHNYIDKAVENGAVAVLISKEIELKHDVDYFLIKDLRKHLGEIAANYYDHPEKKLKIVGVTGTNGKTTTTYLLEQFLDENKVARLGTVEYKIGNEIIEAPNTTPESLDIIKMSKKAVDKGLKYLIMEVSSHGLTSGRVDMLDFDVAGFTNLTPEHLDYHKNMEDYFIAKRILFTKLKDGKNSVINIDDEYGRRLEEEFKGITYSLKEKADLDKEYLDDLEPNLLGKFNMYNLLLSIGMAKLLGVEESFIKEKVKEIKGAPGRFEPVYAGQDFKVIIDYAHTGDALKNILDGVLDIKGNGRVITVFGCGGDRDRTKRPVMGSIAEKYSDYVIVTSDNPRTEDPEFIISEVLSGIKGKNHEVEPDRKLAIKKAIKKAQKDDIILIAGKGHETYQILGKTKIHFDDREIAVEAIKELKEVK